MYLHVLWDLKSQKRLTNSHQWLFVMLFMSLITWLWKFVSVWCRGHKPTTAPETVLRTSKTVFNLLYTLCEIIYELLLISTNDGTTADPPPFFYYHGRVRSTKEKCRLNWARVTPSLHWLQDLRWDVVVLSKLWSYLYCKPRLSWITERCHGRG